MKPLIAVLTGFALVGLLAVVASVLYAHRQVDKVASQRAAHLEGLLERDHEAFLADQAFAAKLELLAPNEGPDAGPFLNPRLQWDDQPMVVSAWRASLGADAPEPSVWIDERTYGLPQDWANAPPEFWAALDFSWMADLDRYGWWDLLSSGPASYMEPFSWYDAPLPNAFSLLTHRIAAA